MRTDEINVQAVLPDSPDAALQSWKASPPPGLSDFELVDEAYNSLTYEKHWWTWYMRITYWLSLGLFG